MPPTLVLMHGMTGTGEMMRPFAEEVCPRGWKLLVPEATFEHPRRGFTWWRYEEDFNGQNGQNAADDSHFIEDSELDGDSDSPVRGELSPSELADIDAGLGPLSEEIESDAQGPIILGGFSQGGAMAQELLHTDLADQVIGLICMATRSVRPEELAGRLSLVMPGKLLWLHGEMDQRVPLDDGRDVADIFEESGWDVTRIEHSKGHMIPLEYHATIRQWLESFS